MKYLLDTHVILWWLTDPKKIAPKAHKLISDKTNEIFISSVSLWEMAIKKSIGRLILPHNLLPTITSEGFGFLSITPEDSLGVADLPLIHNDPFDRLLIIQAKLHDLVIISHDTKIAEYPVAIIKA